MFNKTVLFFLFLFFSFLGKGVHAAEADSLTATELKAALEARGFKNYKNQEREYIAKGSILVSWNSPSSSQINNLRYRYKGEEKWNYRSIDQIGVDSLELDSIVENRFFEWSVGAGENWSSIKESHSLGMHLFENIVLKAGPESMKLSWSINYEVAQILKERGMTAVISYNTDIGKKRIENGIEGNEWVQTESFPITNNHFELKQLAGNEKYHFKLGFVPIGQEKLNAEQKPEMIWSKSKSGKTQRGWGLAKLLILVGSLGFFIYGMKLMSEGLQQASGNMLRSMLGSITANRFKGVLTGFGITSLVQSSSVTTVMTVSFVNAGLMTLRQSAGVMMGANIGTTITAWIILIIGFKVSVGSYAYMLIAIAFPLLFVKKAKAKSWATAIVGFCILFIGLGELKEAVPSLDKDSAIVQFFLDFKGVWYGPIMFVFLGAFVTVVIQSSSAAMALTLAMVAKGAIPFEVACAMVLGENIGTTITAELASIIANVHAKRSARIHSMFNIVGVTWMLLIFPFFLSFIGKLVTYSTDTPFDPENTDMIGTGIALFHTLFNLANVVALIWFVPQLVSLAERTVKSKGDMDEEFKLDFIGGPLGSTAELSILEARKEISKFGVVTARMNGFVKTIINSSDKKRKEKLFRKLEKYEEITDRVEVEIANYLGRAAQLEMSEQTSLQMRAMLSTTNDLERVGDIFYQISKTLERKEADKIYFTPAQREGLNAMLDLVEKAFAIMNSNLEMDYNRISKLEANHAEDDINQMRDKLRKKHLKMIEKGNFHMQGTLMYSNIFSALEKVGDHIINVTEALVGEV